MKRKHPEHEHQRITKRSRRQPPPTRQERANSSSPTAISVTGSLDGLSPHSAHSAHSSEGGEIEMNNTLWHFDPEHHKEHIHPTASTASTTGVKGAQMNPAPLTPQPSMGDSILIDQIVQDATDLERNLLMGTAFFKPTNSFDTQLHPTQSALINSNLTEYNIHQQIQPIADRFSPNDIPQLQDDWFPTPLQISRGCALFFANVSHFLPFLHRPTFDPTQTAPHLVLGILSLAYQHGEDPECDDQEGSGEGLAMRCFHQARATIASDEIRPDALSQNTSMVQSYLLLQICAMMYLCGDNSASGLKMHTHMISLARAGRMTQPLSVETGATADLESLWWEFVKAESHKRTLFAVHQIDALWYQFLSIPRSISHLEIKHGLPCPEDQWTASSSAEWAHRQLVTRSSGPSVQYMDAVRRFLSSDPGLNTIPPFDPYGAINIAQFLISSAREISGWSTMTGMLSMERFSALRSSLVALSPFINPQSDEPATKHTISCSATWETAMIELQMWSPSHTGGIVEGSIDAVLTQSTYLAPSSQFLCDHNTAKAIQPHVNWFLRYLEETVNPDSEAPWVALYAYKAFLIAWQLIHGGLPGAMEVVGVQDGDVDSALLWARRVFQRRQKWQLGKLILSCLDELGK
ncbi:uncharacterized protein N7446_009240 [Penicillium canescens]|uniref:Xylanolytic transcriptional activator regulatory domain-containing protein n=1 Tax=Penicillium canescens TaxID=5083 RepID=A0AAD6I5W4_PENCN|nr:uncharacterized protein N7446_009240 [Penicillium canescens]KAJ6034490.1 hypothetical protein N7460_008665 [Penicillium canescens]KAJ6046150.1 hypothetical protein N7444_007404 [Penicillium canescens]KAJ6053228.1 hypothetical protein N7446_009240 [Penicillium canescens]